MVIVNLVGVGSFSRLFFVGLGALLISTVTASVAGIYLGSASSILELLPGLMVLLPPLLNMRGCISGVLASRLSSSMHLGEFEVSFARDSLLGENIRASLVSTIVVAAVLGVFADIMSRLVGIGSLDFIDFMNISVVSGVLSGLVVMAITLIVAVLSYRYRIDLDMVGAPTVTTSGDLVTLPILIGSALIITALDPLLKNVLFGAIILLLVGLAIYLWKVTDQVRTISRETIPLLIPLAFMGIVAGTMYTTDLDRFVTFAALLILITPFVGGCGSIGGILCSRLATGMHMGSIATDVVPKKDVMPYFFTSYGYAAVLFPLLGLMAHSAALLLGLSSPGLLEIVCISAGSGFILISMVNIIAYATAAMSFRYGLDPDNFGIPVITSTIDFLGAVILISVVSLVL
ncbi:MAG TPA: magnesium transporter MgtE [Methanoculleus sp.]|nr:magnesium transporter MgtE [Methanoculleus sp.]